MATLATGWPTENDVSDRTNVDITASGSEYTASSGVNVSDLLTRAYWHVAERCHRDVHATTRLGFDEAAITDETHDGQTILVVKHPPIVSVSDFEWNGSTLSESDEDFYVYDTYIQLAVSSQNAVEQRDPWRPLARPQYAVIDYTGGFSDAAGTHVAIPHDLKEIVLEVACRWLLRVEQQRRIDKNVQKITAGEISVTYKPDSELLKDLYDWIESLDRTVNVRAL